MPSLKTAVGAFLTAVMGGIGFVLMLPGDTFGSSKSFEVMASLGPEVDWGLAAWIVALVGVFGLATPHKPLRLISIVTVAAAHGTFALCLLLSNTWNTGTLTYSFIAALGYYLAYLKGTDNA
ncbi:MAG: hypothetical protein JWP57_4397 [Spirosoma sp.]|nr:hypothetical protein [Spirosoma sp.]